MAITAVGNTARGGNAAAVTSFSANVSTSGLVVGDLSTLLVTTQAAGTDATIAASGWTRALKTGESTGGVQSYLFWKAFADFDPSTVTVAISGAGSAYSYVSAPFRGCNTTTPLSVSTSAVTVDSVSDTTLNVPAIVTTTANSAVLLCGGAGGTPVFTPPGSYLIRFQSNSGKTCALAWQTIPSASTNTGSLPFTLSAAAEGVSFQVELLPVAASAPINAFE